MQSTTDRDPRVRSHVLAVSVVIVVVIVVGFGLGLLSDYGQTWLPQSTGSVANSSGSWVMVAFVLGLLAATTGMAAVQGGLALVTLVAGYYIAASARGYAESSEQIAFWTLAAVIVGPIIGMAAGWVRRGRPPVAAIGAGAVTGVLLGEGIYGLTKIAATTSLAYWWTQIVVAMVILAVIDAIRVRVISAVFLSAAVAAVAAIAMDGIYGR